MLLLPVALLIKSYFTSGNNIIIQVDLGNDGNAAADMEIQLTGAAITGINAADFIL